MTAILQDPYSNTGMVRFGEYRNNSTRKRIYACTISDLDTTVLERIN